MVLNLKLTVTTVLILKKLLILKFKTAKVPNSVYNDKMTKNNFAI